MLALLAASCDDAEALRRGAEYLMSEQLPNGDWKQEGIAGVFNRACGISYTQYRNIFPMWALARYARHAEVSIGEGESPIKYFLERHATDKKRPPLTRRSSEHTTDRKSVV